MMTTWVEAMRGYAAFETNVPQFEHTFGLRSVGYALGWSVPSLAFAAVWVWRARFTALELCALWLTLPLLFVHAHDYDLVAAIPLVAALLLRHSDSWLRIGLVLMGFAVLAPPMRLVVDLGSPLLSRWREVTLLAMVVWVVVGPILRCRLAPEPRKS